MSAIQIKGTIVSVEKIAGVGKKSGEPYLWFNHYVVNGEGAPVVLQLQAAKKQGEKIEMDVKANAFRDTVTFKPLEV